MRINKKKKKKRYERVQRKVKISKVFDYNRFFYLNEFFFSRYRIIICVRLFHPHLRPTKNCTTDAHQNDRSRTIWFIPRKPRRKSVKVGCEGAPMKREKKIRGIEMCIRKRNTSFASSAVCLLRKWRMWVYEGLKETLCNPARLFSACTFAFDALFTTIYVAHPSSMQTYTTRVKKNATVFRSRQTTFFFPF